MKIKKNIAVSDSGFIFNPNTGDSYSLNKIASSIMKMLKNGVEYEKIKEDVLKKYDIDELSFEKDYYDFMSMLINHSLVENEK